MDVADFKFDLPEELIAQQPLAERGASRLLIVERFGREFVDERFARLEQFFEPGDLLVFNNTRVIPARLHAEKATGGKAELLIERVLDRHRALAQIGANRKPPSGSVMFELTTGTKILVEGRKDEFWHLRLVDPGDDWSGLLERVGHMPLPPYIQRPEQSGDRERYQTVYAEIPGAVAAPTAGLHFDQGVFERLDEQGIGRAFCTLHVGAGTFQPVRVDQVEAHQMHPEWLCVDQDLVDRVNAVKRAGRRVVAVGTTAVRSLETAAESGTLVPFTGDSRLFIYPGYKFRVVDAMITNFHLPGSTLMMLVSAFAGRDTIMAAYRHAIQQRYRFFSYGDAMLIR
ncbi:MAG: tRNA preQ1(34) S-adenosylmethionine ribosyltransferase-isomerase QueA [Xanthomonadaceae bacterium]|nr:tRNA preQ1(34) S-adenosylmethionine ribosyltransferase-isomerase QueA [Xanthomonadaceae bacterium]